jgi:hypothetical protein
MEDNHVKPVAETLITTNQQNDEIKEKFDKSRSSSEMMTKSQLPISSITEENQIGHLSGWRLYLLTTGFVEVFDS